MLVARADGTVLPILHLNGYKIAAVLARIAETELVALLDGYGQTARSFAGGDDPANDAPADGGGAGRGGRGDHAVTTPSTRRSPSPEPPCGRSSLTAREDVEITAAVREILDR